MYFFKQKMGWATFWAIFSQTHLVTLLMTVGISPCTKQPGRGRTYTCVAIPVQENKTRKDRRGRLFIALTTRRMLGVSEWGPDASKSFVLVLSKIRKCSKNDHLRACFQKPNLNQIFFSMHFNC
jgi:hypothetical protein